MIELKEGDKAPGFSGINQNGKTLKLSDFKGKRLILYFYPKDNTPGCTAESCNLNENYDELTKHGFEVVGVSPDEAGKHQKFIAKYDLAFNLIADTEKEMLQAYGAWGEKKLYGKVYDGVLRSTFVISPDSPTDIIIPSVVSCFPFGANGSSDAPSPALTNRIAPVSNSPSVYTSTPSTKVASASLVSTTTSDESITFNFPITSFTFIIYSYF